MGWWTTLAPRGHLVRRWLGMAAALLLFSLGASAAPARAQSSESVGAWTSPAPIPGYTSHMLPPHLLVDGAGTVHAFSNLRFLVEGEPAGVLYSSWQYGRGWTLPTVIMLPIFRGQVWVEAAHLDERGVIHLVLFSGDDIAANVYYSSASALQASNAQAWSRPQRIGSGAITPRAVALAARGADDLMVTFSGKRDGVVGLFAVDSSDAGATWSEPQRFFTTESAANAPFYLGLLSAADGTIHAVWNVVDVQGANVAGYLARLAPDTETWSTPQPFDTSLALGIAIPVLYQHQGTLFLLYNNGVTGGVSPQHWLQRSADGVNWTAPELAFPHHVGRNGTIAMVADAGNTLHALFGQRIPGGVDGIDMHGLWYSTWDGQRWREPEFVVTGPRLESAGPEQPGFDPFDARAVVVRGNVLLTVWRTDPGRGADAPWYAFRQLDAPSVAALPVPTPAVDDAPPAGEATPTPPAAAAAEALPFSTLPPAAGGLDQGRVLLYGVLPAAGILLLLVLILTRRILRQ